MMRRCVGGRAGRWTVALALLSGAGVVALDGSSPAQAFDCRDAAKCPFVKIENTRLEKGGRTNYEAWATLSDGQGNTLHEWHEDDPEYTLWHWRHYGGDGQVEIRIRSWGRLDSEIFSADNHFITAADRSICIKIDEAGAYQTGGCTDYEDPARPG
jgi:hypothetical protein